MGTENTNIWPATKRILRILAAILFFVAGIAFAGFGLMVFISVGPTIPKGVVMGPSTLESWQIYVPCFVLGAGCFFLGYLFLPYSKDPSSKKPRSALSTTPQIKRKKSQLIGYFLCWVCTPIFLFGAAFCDHGDYCGIAKNFAWLIMFGCIPLIIGQVILYRSKLSFPPLDAFVFLCAVLCELTFVLFPLGVVLWAVGIIIEIVLLFYVLIRTICEILPKEHSNEKVVVQKLDKNSHAISSSVITPLLQAVMDGKLEKAKEVLTDNTAQLNTTYAPNGNTPLHVAALNGYTEIVRLLLEQPGIDTTRTNNEGKTALDLAHEKGFEEIVWLLENK